MVVFWYNGCFSSKRMFGIDDGSLVESRRKGHGGITGIATVEETATISANIRPISTPPKKLPAVIVVPPLHSLTDPNAGLSKSAQSVVITTAPIVAPPLAEESQEEKAAEESQEEQTHATSKGKHPGVNFADIMKSPRTEAKKTANTSNKIGRNEPHNYTVLTAENVKKHMGKKKNGVKSFYFQSIIPTKERTSLFRYLYGTKIQLNVYGYPVTYGTMGTVLAAILAAFASRILLQEMNKVLN